MLIVVVEEYVINVEVDFLGDILRDWVSSLINVFCFLKFFCLVWFEVFNRKRIFVFILKMGNFDEVKREVKEINK